MSQNLGILLYENVQPIDIIGPWEVFSIWKSVLKAPINLYLIAEQNTYIHCDSNITLKAHMDFKHCPNLDYLIIPGGKGRVDAAKNKNLLTFIQQQAPHCRYIISVCTGAFLLHQSGVLKNEAITTYWRALPELLALKDVKVLEKRVVKSGKIWASGGLSSGIDLAFALIEEITDAKTAGQVQLLFEYYPEDTLYASPEDLLNTLPPYYGGEKPKDLPEYIKEYLQTKIK